LAQDRDRDADEETSQHEVGAFGGGQPSPAAPTQPTWQPPQPPAPAGWNQPQPGWNQPQPGWGQPAQPGAWQSPAGWQQPAHWPAPYGSSGGAIVAAVILLIYGIPLLLFGGLVTLVAVSIGDAFTQQLRSQLEAEGLAFDIEAMMRFVVLVFAIVFVLGLVHVVAAIGVLMHKGWGRLLGVVMATLGVLFGALTLAPALTVGEPGSLVFALLLVAGYGLVLLGLITGGSHFRRLSAGRW